MTRYLADTHIALWLLDTPERLSPAQRDVLESDATVFLSTASLWEIAIKASLGKLNPPLLIAESFEDLGFDTLPIEPRHIELVKVLPFVKDHRDPFDRMLIAQAMVERLPILTADARFRDYDLHVI